MSFWKCCMTYRLLTCIFFQVSRPSLLVAQSRTPIQKIMWFPDTLVMAYFRFRGFLNIPDRLFYYRRNWLPGYFSTHIWPFRALPPPPELYKRYENTTTMYIRYCWKHFIFILYTRRQGVRIVFCLRIFLLFIISVCVCVRESITSIALTCYTL